MYSPQRYRVPYQKSPNRTLGQLNTPKRKSPERLTLDEFVASKKAKVGSNSDLTTTRVATNIIPTNRIPTHRIPATRGMPSSSRMSTVSPKRMSISPRNVNTPRTSLTRMSPHRKSPITPSRMSTIIKSNSPTQRNPITPTNSSAISRSRNSILFSKRRNSIGIKNEKSTIQPVRSLYSQSSPTKIIPIQEQRIKVCVRKRPLNKREIAVQEQDIAPLSGYRTIEIHAPK